MESSRVASSSKALSWSLQLQLRRFLFWSCCRPSSTSPAARTCSEHSSIRHSNARTHELSCMPKQLCPLSQPSAASTEVEPFTCGSRPINSTNSLSSTVLAPPAATLTNLSAGYHSVEQCTGIAFSSSPCSDETQGPATQQSRLQSALLARRQQRWQLLDLLAQTQPGCVLSEEAEASCQVSGTSSICTPTGVLQPLLTVERSSPEAYSNQPVQQSSMEGLRFSRPSPQPQASHRRRSCYADTPTDQPAEAILQQQNKHSPAWHAQVSSESAHGGLQHSTEAVDVQESEQFFTLLQQGTADGRFSSGNSSSSAKCDLAACQAGGSVVSSTKQHLNQSSNTTGVSTVLVDAFCDDSLLPDWHECDDEVSSPTGRRLMELQDEAPEVEQHQPQQQDGPERSTQHQQQESYEESTKWLVPAPGGMNYAESVNRIMSLLETCTSTAGEGPVGDQLYEVLCLSVLGPVVETVTVRALPNRPQGLNSMDVAAVLSRFTDEWPGDAEGGARTHANNEFGRPVYVSEVPGIGAFAGSSIHAEFDWGLNGLLRQGSEDGYITAVEVAEEGEKSKLRQLSTSAASCPAVFFCSAACDPTSDMVQGSPLCRPATG